MRVAKRVALTALLAFPATAVAARAATPLQSVRISTDVTAVLGAQTVDDEKVASDDLAGGVTPVSIGPIPSWVDLDGYQLPPNGNQLLSFDTTLTLPGEITARPADVVRYDGTVYTVEFDAAAHGVPLGADVDAIAIAPNGDLLLSFDVAVVLSGITLDDEDVARFDGVGFTSFFDGGSAGIDYRLDLDALDVLCNGHLLVSFDISGVVGGVGFDDEDLLEYDPGAGTWELAYDGSAEHAGWAVADLDALDARVAEAAPVEAAGLQVSRLPAVTRLTWASQAAAAGICTKYDVVTGALQALRVDAGFDGAACLAGSLSEAVFDDTRPVPAPGEGVYYLVRARNGAGTATYGDASTVPDPRDDLDAAGPCP